MSSVAAFVVVEVIDVDRSQLRAIADELGEIAAEGLIQLALEQMAVAVSVVIDGVCQGEMKEAAKKAERLSRLAGQVGLTTLAGVAVDLVHCAGGRDTVAIEAVRHRLERVANRSLTEIWDEFCPHLAPGPGG